VAVLQPRGEERRGHPRPHGTPELLSPQGSGRTAPGHRHVQPVRRPASAGGWRRYPVPARGEGSCAVRAEPRSLQVLPGVPTRRFAALPRAHGPGHRSVRDQADAGDPAGLPVHSGGHGRRGDPRAGQPARLLQGGGRAGSAAVPAPRCVHRR
jgi:hypothetical protein